MKVACHRCSANNTFDEAELEEKGELRLQCVECGARLVVDEHGQLVPDDEVAPPDSDEEGSDEFATIRLPSPAELGLNPAPKAKPAAVPAPAPPPPPVAAGVVPPPPPPAAANPLPAPTPPPPPTTSTAAKPHAPIPGAPGAPGPDPSAALRPAPTPNTAVSSAAGATLGQLERWTVSLPKPPVRGLGWAVVGGLVLTGLLLGALVAGPGESSHGAFDSAAAKREITKATGGVLECFQGDVPNLSGKIELLFSRDGEVEEFLAHGPLASGDHAECMQDRFSQIEVPEFSGPMVRVTRTVKLRPE